MARQMSICTERDTGPFPPQVHRGASGGQQVHLELGQAAARERGDHGRARPQPAPGGVARKRRRQPRDDCQRALDAQGFHDARRFRHQQGHQNDRLLVASQSFFLFLFF